MMPKTALGGPNLNKWSLLRFILIFITLIIRWFREQYKHQFHHRVGDSPRCVRAGWVGRPGGRTWLGKLAHFSTWL